MPDYSVTIPEIEIARDWYVNDLTSVAECDDALDYLTEAIASIEAQLMQDSDRGPAWRAATSKSLRFKKRAYECVTQRRAFFASRERRAMVWLQTNELPIWSRAMAAVSDGQA